MLSIFIVAKEESHSVNFSHGATLSTHTILPAATSITSELIAPAIQLAEQIFQSSREYKKAGVMLSGLVPDETIQGNLFAEQKNNNRLLIALRYAISFHKLTKYFFRNML